MSMFRRSKQFARERKSDGEEKPLVVYGALAANLVIGIAKLVAAALSGSSVMISEGIHSLADSGNELLLLLGLQRSRLPADDRHPYGHGKELYFWSLIVAMVLFAGGGGMSIYEGISHILEPEPLRDPTYNYVVLGIALVFESSSLLVAVRRLKRDLPGRSYFAALRASKDPTVFMVAGEDTAALIGIAVAFAGVLTSQLTGMAEFDGVASLVVGAILCAVSLLLASETRALLIGESGGAALNESIEKISRSDPSVRRTGRALTMQLGPREVLLNLELEFSPQLSMRELRTAIERIESEIRAAHPEVTRIFLEARALQAAEPQPSP